jgi:hypothetical protein
MPSLKARPSTAPSRIETIEEASRRIRPETVRVDDRFSYALLLPVAEDDLNPYIHDPIAALPATVRERLPKICIVLVPWLEKPSGKGSAVLPKEKPVEAKLQFSARTETKDLATLFFTIKSEQISDFHYYFYDEIAALLSRRWPVKVQDLYHALLREEIAAEVNGEVDEKSWRLKQAVLRRPLSVRKDGKLFSDYARQSFEDTMTLYLHGLCCDIDVETGPRQLPSRHMRKRLELLKSVFPPPEGHAVFPEDLVEHYHRH